MDNIKAIAYELYKIDWKNGRITNQIEKDTYNNYIEYLDETAKNNEIDHTFYPVSYSNYITEFGFAGVGIYSGFDEFLDNEYQDKDYIKSILPEHLYETYLSDKEDTNKEKTYSASIKCDGRYYVEVRARSIEEAKEKAKIKFQECDIGELECVDSCIVNITDENGNFLYEA